MKEAGIVIAPLAVEACALRTGEHSFRVVRCGMGPSRAREAAHRLRSDRAKTVVVGGLCGAIHPDFEPGDLVVPDRLHVDGRPTREVDGGPLRRLLASKGWPVHGGTLLGVDRIVTNSKRSMLLDSGADALDMESAWLADAAGSRPFVVLRVVVDGPTHELLRARTLVRGWRALTRLHQASAVLDQWAEHALQGSQSISSS